jgi:subtilisin family serine protease
MAAQVGYEALGQWHEISLLPLQATDSTGVPRAMRGRRAVRVNGGSPGGTRLRANDYRSSTDADSIASAIKKSPVLKTRVSDPSGLRVVQGTVPVRRSAAGLRARPPAPMSTYDAVTLATETVITEGLRQADLAAAKNYGARVIEEGLDGKTLLAVDTVERAFGLVDFLLKREVGSATPNFLRRVGHVQKAAPEPAWSHAKIGVKAAWKITTGDKDVKVAVLDEGVDTSHPALRAAGGGERDVN